MKKTLQEEKDRMFDIMKKISPIMEQIPGPNLNEPEDAYVPPEGKSGIDDVLKESDPLYSAINQYIDTLTTKGIKKEEIYQKLIEIVQYSIELDKEKNEEIGTEEPYDPPTLRYRDDGGTDGG